MTRPASDRPDRMTAPSSPSWVAGAARLVIGVAPVFAALAHACASQGPAGSSAQAPTVDRTSSLGRSTWIDDAGLRAPGFGRVSFATKAGHVLTALTYRGTAFDAQRGPVWFVMHGVDRDADRYIRVAAPVAERNDALAIAIEFSRAAYPKDSDYSLGLEAGDRQRPDARWRAPADTPYAEVERVFDAVRHSLGGQQAGYFLFGHSAGAQFVHRLLLFLPAPRVLRAVAANAGWYTLPTSADPRLHAMPYGLAGGPVDPSRLKSVFATPLVILLGDADRQTAAQDSNLRSGPLADAQGPHRFARGQHFFTVARERAAALGARFAWQLAIVPRAGHDAAAVIDSAGFLTFAADATVVPGTRAPDAAGVIITEFFAGSNSGPPADTNLDGLCDANEDQFVEIVNAGAASVCLTGWTLSDARRPGRHVFPVGSVLAPSESMVVFGGGIPTGRFHGAKVQWSDRGLGLTGKGDVLVLGDAEDVAVCRVTWGDVAVDVRGADHWLDPLPPDASLARPPIAHAAWRVHPTVDGKRCSPGSPLLPSSTPKTRDHERR